MNNAIFDNERRHYPILNNCAYFDAGTTGMVADFVYNATKEYQDKRLYHGGNSIWGGAMNSGEMFAWVRRQMADMIGGDADYMAFGENTSQMMAQFISNLPLSKGDNVIMTDTSFISMVFNWDLRRQREGIELRYAKANKGITAADELIALVDSNTRVISLNHVEPRTGFRHDLHTIGKFCKDNDILLMVDAAQTAGIMPIDVKAMNIDFVAAANYKWMQGFSGNGFGYFSPKAIGRLAAPMAGWRSSSKQGFEDAFDFEQHSDARKYEYGFPNTPGVYAFGLVAERYLQLGAAQIEARVLELVKKIWEKADERPGLNIWSRYDAVNLSQLIILTFDEPYNITAEGLAQNGAAAGVWGGDYYNSKGALRIGVHYFNNESDVDALFNAIDNCKGEPKCK